VTVSADVRANGGNDALDEFLVSFDGWTIGQLREWMTPWWAHQFKPTWVISSGSAAALVVAAGASLSSAILACAGLIALVVVITQSLARLAWDAGRGAAYGEFGVSLLLQGQSVGVRIGDTPPPVAGAGYLYVIRFRTGTVKVGQTQDVRRRLAEHRRDAAAFGVGITHVWVSEPMQFFVAAEDELIAHCLKASKRTRREYFHNVDYVAAVEFAKSLSESFGGRR
jgi:predicted GIY-YIG superfamily endonuclease